MNDQFMSARRTLLKGAALGGFMAAAGHSLSASAATNKTKLIEPISGYNDTYAKAFSLEEYNTRLRRLRALMAKAKIDVLCVSSPQGMCYLHGYAATWYRAQSPRTWFPQAATFVHVDRDELVHFDSTFETALLAATSIVENPVYLQKVDSAQAIMGEMLSHLKSKGWLTASPRVGLELYSCVPSPAVSMAWQEVIRAQGLSIFDGTAAIRAVQKVKSAQELAYIRQAARICDIGHQAIIDSFQDGITQLELTGNAYQAMFAAGGEPAGINQGVMSGPYISGHNIASTRRIRRGEVFGADLGIAVNRYHANISHMYCAGDPPDFIAQAAEYSAGAYPVLERVARPGATINHVIAELQKYYGSTPMADQFGYFLGYELGIAFPPDWVNEWNFGAPSLESFDEMAVFEANTVTNFESLYAPNDMMAGNIDTIIYGVEKTETLGALPKSVLKVG